MKDVISIFIVVVCAMGTLQAQLSRHRLSPPIEHSKSAANKTLGMQAKSWGSIPGVVWGPIIKLSPDDPYPSGGSFTPKLAVHGDTIHCVWYGYSPFRLPYIRSTNDGFSWEPPRDLLTDSSGLPTPVITGAYQILVEPTTVFIFFVGPAPGVPNGQGGTIYFMKSMDRGTTWLNPVRATADTVSYLHYTSVRGDTMAAVYTPDFNGQVSYPRITRSTDAGSTWTRNPFRMPSSNSALLLRDILSPGLLNFFHSGEQWPGPAPEIVLHRSTDLADSWKDSLVLSPIDGDGSDMPEVASFEHPGTGDAASRTTIAVMWRGEEFTGAWFSAGMALRLSNNNGKTWEPMTIVSDTPRGSSHAVTIEGNKIAVAWSHELGDFGPFRVKARLSYDCGLSWDTVYNLTPFAENAGLPSVALTESAVHVAWEQDDDPFGSHRWNIYYQRGELPKMTPSYSSPSLEFDTVIVGCSIFKILNVRNIRCDPLYLTSHPSNDQDFSVTPEVAIVSPGDSVTLSIRFAPLTVGNKSAQLILLHNQCAVPDTIPLSAAAIGTGSEIAVTDSFGVGWQLISVPVETPCAYLLPGSYSYNGVYQPTDTLRAGSGYWNKFNVPKLSFAGFAIAADTMPVVIGWNLIGSISTAVQVVNITSNPPGIVTSQFFGYLSSYTVSDSLQPGRAYWVKVNQSGELILTSSVEAIAANGIRIVPTEELPPSPPGGALSNPIVQKPNHLLLEQNYPNPFNPSTVIRYQLPVVERNETSLYRVNLDIYDVLGRHVITLVDGMQEAGYKTVTWNASAIASGMYFYRLMANGITDTRKLLILK